MAFPRRIASGSLIGPRGRDGLPGVNAVPTSEAVDAYLADGATDAGLDTAATRILGDIDSDLYAALLGLITQRGEAPVPYLKSVPMWIYGDSYTQADPPEATPGPQVARRNKMMTPVNRGISGTRFAQIFQRIVDTWTPNTRGLVVIGDGSLNNIQTYPATTAGYATAREAFRALLAYLSDRDVRKAADAAGAITVFGPGWTATDDGYEGSVGEYVDLAWDSGQADIYVKLTTGAGGTLQVKNTAGTVVGTIATGGYAEDLTGVVTIPTQGAGVHTVRATVTVGTVEVRRVGARAATPPLIVWDKVGPVPGLDTTELRASQAQETVAAAAFPNVLVSDNDVTGWDPDTMIVADQVHRNDGGNGFASATMQTLLQDQVTDYRQGLNAVDHYTADAAYTVPTPSYTGPGAVVPAAPVLTAAGNFQVRLTWTRPTDGGSTLTGYRIESSPAGAGTWTLLATISNPVQQEHLVTSGLTPGSSYDFRVRAINAIGGGTWSVTKTVTAGPEPVFYSRDDFNRADAASLGTPPVGGIWTPHNATWGILADKAAQTSAPTDPGLLLSRVTLSDGQGGGYAKVRIVHQDPIMCGITMNNDSSTAPTVACALVAHMASGTYRFLVQYGANDYAIGAIYDVVPRDGDEIGIYRDGLDYYSVINGVVQPVFTGVSSLAGVIHGLVSNTNGAEWDDWSHTNLNPTL